MYQFSIPMPINRVLIDEVDAVNKNFSLSKINNFYFALPLGCDKSTGFENVRYPFKMETDYNYWRDLFSYSLDKGFSFTYLLNSHFPFYSTTESLDTKWKKLDILLKDLTSFESSFIELIIAKNISSLRTIKLPFSSSFTEFGKI